MLRVPQCGTVLALLMLAGTPCFAQVPASAPVAAPPATPLTTPIFGTSLEDRDDSMLEGDMLLDRPGYPAPGWLVAVELDLFGLHLRNRLTNEVSISGWFTDTVHLPTATLGWTGSPRIELGYRLPQGAGAVIGSYYSIVAESCGIISNYDAVGEGALRSRLNVNVADLDYGNDEYSLSERWDMKWRLGVRVASVYFDSRAQGWFMGQRTSNNFIGAGPHFGLDLRRRFASPRWSLFGRLEGAGSIGRITQNFEETFAWDGTPLGGGATKVSVVQWVPTVRTQLGVAWTPWLTRPFAISTGYIFEGWWYLGEADGSSATLTGNGLFLRAEWNY